MFIKNSNRLNDTINNTIKIFSLFFIYISLTLSLYTITLAETPAKPSSFKIPKIEQAPKIDGILSEGEWTQAAIVSNFFQTNPGDNTPASEQTQVYLFYDSKNLYIAFDCRVTKIETIRATVAKRDNVFSDDNVFIYLDTFYDQQRAYGFFFNPLGIQGDCILTEDNGSDFSFDAVLTSKGNITDEGYIVEAAIPFRSLRYKEGKWGLHIGRGHRNKSESDSWMPIERGTNSYLGQEGYFDGLDELPKGRTFEIIPTLTFSEVGQRINENKFFNRPVDTTSGVSIKYSITPNLTADLAIKPDFSQVEADFPQIQVNNRFPLFFPEKRPFFLEGADIFETPFSLVQTRNIVSPLFAAKLTGKLGKYSLGLLTALDENAPSERFSSTSESFSKNALFSILRLKRDIFKGSNIGFLIADREFAGSFNRVASIDGSFLIGKNYNSRFQYVQTLNKDLDGTFTSGRAAMANLSFSNKRFNYSTYYEEISPDYLVDSGFTSRTDTRSFGGSVGSLLIQHETPEAKLRGLSVNFFNGYTFDQKGQLTDRDFNASAFMNFKYNTFAFVGANQSRVRFANVDFDLKGASALFGTSFSKRLGVSASFSFGDGILFNSSSPQLGNRLSYNASFSLKPNDKLSAVLNLIHSQLSSKSGEKFFNITIYRAQINQQFTRNTSARFITSYNTFSRTADASLLFSYTPNPGTAIFVGYNDLLRFGDERSTTPRESGLTRLERSFFIKFSYLIRLNN